MRDFKFCYPDANTFSKVLKIKKLEEWNYEYHKLDGDVGYWIAESPFHDNGFDIFRELIGSFPIQKDNNHPDNRDPNPFDTIHVPEWVSKDICFLIRDFYFKHVTDKVLDPQIHEWGNIYFKHRARPIGCWRIPHMDYVHGLVANMWFTDHPVEESSTRLYKYTGKIYGDVYDFQVEVDHPMRKEWEAIATTPVRLDAWKNLPKEEMKKWGFEYLGETPTREGTMTMYKANICHDPFVAETVEFRWSHAFAYSHEEYREQTLGDFFKL